MDMIFKTALVVIKVVSECTVKKSTVVQRDAFLEYIHILSNKHSGPKTVNRLMADHIKL
jgi:hypothetical protein